MKTILLWIIGAIVITGAGWYYYNYIQYAPTTYVTDTPSGSTTTNTVTGTTSTTTPTYTMVDVAAHKDASSCYSVINDSVYDVTMWVNMHPGGKGAILSLCGVDGTERFMKKHKGGEKYITILARYKIGVVSAAPTASIPAGVACTMDAKQCPDGSYVGRSGPQCQFVCP